MRTRRSEILSAHKRKTMELYHFSTASWALDRSMTYGQGITRKPRGLWVSDETEGGWSTWVRNMEMGSSQWPVTSRTLIELTPSARVPVLATWADIEALYEWAGVERVTKYDHIKEIDWGKVAKHYDGIIITPYGADHQPQGYNKDMVKPWGAIGSQSWIDGWDIASGCIWNMDAIAE